MINTFPNAYAHYENEITLPLPTLQSEEDADYVIESYSDIVKGYLADGLNRLE